MLQGAVCFQAAPYLIFFTTAEAVEAASLMQV